MPTWDFLTNHALTVSEQSRRAGTGMALLAASGLARPLPAQPGQAPSAGRATGGS